MRNNFGNTFGQYENRKRARGDESWRKTSPCSFGLREESFEGASDYKWDAEIIEGTYQQVLTSAVRLLRWWELSCLLSWV